MKSMYPRLYMNQITKKRPSHFLQKIEGAHYSFYKRNKKENAVRKLSNFPVSLFTHYCFPNDVLSYASVR